MLRITISAESFNFDVLLYPLSYAPHKKKIRKKMKKEKKNLESTPSFHVGLNDRH